MKHANNQKRPVKTVEIAFELLNTIKVDDGITLKDLAEKSELAKSTVHRHLGTLEAQGFVIKQDDQYYLALRFLDFGIKARNTQKGFRLAREKTRELAKESGELSIFMVEEHGRGYIICREEGQNAVKTDTRVGIPLFLHATSGGKAILSQYSDKDVHEILDTWSLPARTSHTITDRSELFKHLEQVQEDGYSVNREEHVQGLQSIGAPIINDNIVIGALCISGPTKRMTGKYLEDSKNLLLGAANELELNMKYS